MRIVELVFFGFFFFLFALSIPTGAQSNLQNLYRPATHVWLGETSGDARRQVFSLNGLWQASCNAPKFASQVQVPGAFLFEGEVSFARNFHLPDSLRRRNVRLHVNGLNNEAQIAVNGLVVSRHIGGYLSFATDLHKENLRFGQDNLITITVDNSLSPIGSLPPKHRPMGWRNEGGIIREIYLEFLPEIHIADYKFKYALQSEGVAVDLMAQAHASADSPAEVFQNLTVILEIWDAARLNKLASSTPLPLSAWQSNRHEVTLSCRLPNPALWSPVSPNLYALRIILQQEKSLREKVLVDELWQETGFRKVELRDKELWLNGERVTLRGVNWIEEYGEAALLDTLRLQKLLAVLAQLGANALRVVGHPPHPLLPVLCDRAGIFLLEELPWYYLTEAHFRQSRFAPIARTQLADMVRRDRHHASVLAWGLGVAGAPSSPAAQSVVEELAATLRAQDGRLIYVVTPPAWQSLWQPHVDFLLVEWLKRSKVDSLVFLQNRSAKLILPVFGHHLSATRADAEQGMSLASLSRAEEMQAEYFNSMFKALHERPRAGGYFLHSLFDWKGPMPYLAAGALSQTADENFAKEAPGDWSELGNIAGTRIQPWGIVSANGQRRLAFQKVQGYNRGEEASPVPQRWPADHPGVFQIAGIALIVIFLFFLQRDRRLRAGLRRVFVHPHGFYHDLYEHRKVAPFLTILVGLVESAVVAFLLAQLCYAFRQSLGFDQVLNLLFPEGAGKALVTWLIWHPGWFMLSGTIVIFVLGLVVGFLFRIFGALFGTSVPLIQYVTSIFWACANLVFLAALTPVFYRLLLNSDAWRPLFMLVFAFIIWMVIRLFRAMRVLYMASYVRAAVVFIVVFGGLLFMGWFYFDRTSALTDYARYYLVMLRIIG